MSSFDEWTTQDVPISTDDLHSTMITFSFDVLWLTDTSTGYALLGYASTHVVGTSSRGKLSKCSDGLPRYSEVVSWFFYSLPVEREWWYTFDPGTPSKGIYECFPGLSLTYSAHPQVWVFSTTVWIDRSYSLTSGQVLPNVTRTDTTGSSVQFVSAWVSFESHVTEHTSSLPKCF